MEPVPAQLDKSKFQKTMKLCALKVPVKSISEVQKKIRSQMFSYNKAPAILAIDNDRGHKLILLDQFLNKQNYAASWPDYLK